VQIEYELAVCCQAVHAAPVQQWIPLYRAHTGGGGGGSCQVPTRLQPHWLSIQASAQVPLNTMLMLRILIRTCPQSHRRNLKTHLFVKCPSILTNSEKVRNISHLPIGSHIKVRIINPYGFDYKIGDRSFFTIVICILGFNFIPVH
jgi:hypothetical protein